MYRASLGLRTLKTTEGVIIINILEVLYGKKLTSK